MPICARRRQLAAIALPLPAPPLLRYACASCSVAPVNMFLQPAWDDASPSRWCHTRSNSLPATVPMAFPATRYREAFTTLVYQLLACACATRPRRLRWLDAGRLRGRSTIVPRWTAVLRVHCCRALNGISFAVLPRVRAPPAALDGCHFRGRVRGPRPSPGATT